MYSPALALMCTPELHSCALTMYSHFPALAYTHMYSPAFMYTRHALTCTHTHMHSPSLMCNHLHSHSPGLILTCTRTHLHSLLPALMCTRLYQSCQSLRFWRNHQAKKHLSANASVIWFGMWTLLKSPPPPPGIDYMFLSKSSMPMLSTK